AIFRIIAVSLLRAAVGDAGHAERAGVVVRGLLGVADDEGDVVDPGDGERIRYFFPGPGAGCAGHGVQLRRGAGAGQRTLFWMVNMHISSALRGDWVSRLTSTVDALDADLLALLAAEPRIGVLECARRLRVA